MPNYHTIWLCLSLGCAAIGFIGVVWCRCARRPSLTCWGRRLFLLMLTASGGGSLLAAFQPNIRLSYLGLAFCGLVIAMVWEAPPVKRA